MKKSNDEWRRKNKSRLKIRYTYENCLSLVNRWIDKWGWVIGIIILILFYILSMNFFAKQYSSILDNSRCIVAKNVPDDGCNNWLTFQACEHQKCVSECSEFNKKAMESGSPQRCVC